MPRQITPRPAEIVQPPQVVAQHLDNIMIEAGLALDGSIDPTKVFLTFQIFEVKSDSTYAVGKVYNYPLDQWPQQIRDDIKTLRQHLLTAAENLGILDSGTDEGEIT